MATNTNQRDTVVGVFNNREDAQRAIQDLRDAGFNGDDIGILMQDKQGASDLAEETGTKSGEAAGIGATTGGILGALGGLLVGLGALAIPGIGPVLAAGPLVAAFGAIAGGTATGAVIGAGTGAIAGALVGLGIPEDEANFYEQGFNNGGILVTVKSGASRFNEAQQILRQDGAQDIESGAAAARTTTTTGAAQTAPAANYSQSTTTTTQNTNYANTGATQTTDANTVRVPVVEESLTANKQTQQAGEVAVHKHVEEQQVSIPVELHHEEVTVTRHAVDRPVDAGDQVFQDGEVIRVPLSEETVDVQKRARVTGEVEINKNVVAEQHTVGDTVRREVVDVNTDGNVLKINIKINKKMIIKENKI